MNRACDALTPTCFGTFLPSAGRSTPLAPGLFFPRRIGRPQNSGRNAAARGTVEQTGLTVLKEDARESSALETSDLELVRKAGDGDSAAFHALVDRFAPDLFRLAQSLSSTRTDAEDIVQETFFGAFRALKQFDGRASVKTWLKRILVRQAARAWHKSRSSRKAMSIEAVDMQERPASSNNGTPPAVANVDRKIDVGAVLRSLPPEYRQILVLREFEQMSYAEIAQMLGVPQGTVESRLHRARAELRNRLAGYNQ